MARTRMGCRHRHGRSRGELERADSGRHSGDPEEPPHPGDGPALLVVDEYQMIGDADRGLNYELALALAPPQTQLLLLSGSVANPQDVVKWLHRLGRTAVLIRHEHRPVPLEEVQANNLNFHVPSEIEGYWPRLAAKALAEDLGPILIFAPRRHAAESMAAELARNLPTPNPLQLSTEQKLIAGEHLAKLLKSRIAFITAA